ncbi:MAG: L-threonine 3-dehydrogenase [Spirochaetia bacterium]|nr:L-threonine 3-dehydrogenase [Spirochaetia bacterium]
MKALVIEKPNHAVVKEVPIPEVGKGEIRIQVKASGICGTDIHIYRGEYLGSYPIIPGHEFAGIVDAVGEGVTRFALGDHVAVEPNISCNNCNACFSGNPNFCENWQGVGVTRPGGFAQYVVVPETAAFSIASLDFAQGSFMEPLSCVLHGIQKAQVHLADKILIMGAGPIGILLLKTVLTQGASEVTQLDTNKGRLQLAKKSGAKHIETDIKNLSNEAYDMVIDATGVPFLLEKSLDLARKGGTLLWFAVPKKDAKVTLPPFKIFEKGLHIVSSFTSVRNSVQAIRMLENGKIDVSDVISHRLRLEDFVKGIETIERSEEGVLKVIVTF